MCTELYLDTARLGRMNLRAHGAHEDFLRLCRDEGGSAHVEDLLRQGFDAWPGSLRRRYASLADWGGVEGLKRSLRTLTGTGPETEVLLAQRSAQLMRLAARALFRRCTRVLHTDLEWPGYLRILRAEGTRVGRDAVCLPVREKVFRDRIAADELARLVAAHYRRQGCDGLFLSAVSYEGIRLPVGALVELLSLGRAPRFVAIDGAQALGHAPLDVHSCDLYLSGSHKWLRAGLPLGMAFAPRPDSRGLLRMLCEEMIAGMELEDPLLSLTREIERDALEPYGETVSLAPLLTLAAATAAAIGDPDSPERRFRTRLGNGGELAEVAERTGWHPQLVDGSLRSGILLLRAGSADVQAAPPGPLRSRFQRAGLALTAYPDGVVRSSLPPVPWEDADLDQIRSTLRACS